MRSFSSLLVLETLLDSVASSDPILNSVVNQVFQPHVRIVERSCSTRLGEPVDVNFEAEGKVELATGQRLSRSRIEALLGRGVYRVATRTLSTCVSGGGVCAACYAASRPLEEVRDVNDIVVVHPLFDKGSEVFGPLAPREVVSLGLDPDSYTSLLVFVNGEPLDPSEFSVSGSSLTVIRTLPINSYIVVRYQSVTRVPYMFWLANTYSGSLLGVKALPAPLLSVRSLLLTELVANSPLETLLDETRALSSIPEGMLEFASHTQDKLERALFLISLRAIYDNVQV